MATAAAQGGFGEAFQQPYRERSRRDRSHAQRNRRRDAAATRTCARPQTEVPASTQRRGEQQMPQRDGALRKPYYRLDPPSPTDFHTPRTSKARQTPNETRRREGETGKAGTEGGETTTPPSLVHLQERPGPPQEHHTRRAETDAHARPSGGRAARRGDPLPCRDSESQPAPKERRRHDTGSCLPRFGTPTARARAGKQGRAGYRTPAFHTPPTVGQRSEGPAGSTRSAVHSP